MNRVLSFLAAVLVTGLAAAPLLAQAESERLLLPVFTPPVHGAHGSEFHTELRIANNSQNTVTVLGIDGGCTIVCLPGGPAFFPLGAGEEAGPDDIAFNGSPGRFIYVPTDQVSSLSMNLRVFDVTRDAQNFGTEIPIVRERDFVNNRIVLVGVPTDPRFRNTLRIYSPMASFAVVTVGDRPPVTIPLTGGAGSQLPGFPDLFVPAYGSFTDFPAGNGPVRVTIQAGSDIVTLLPFETLVWAFVTVTNNDTQAITTITPHP